MTDVHLPTHQNVGKVANAAQEIVHIKATVFVPP